MYLQCLILSVPLILSILLREFYILQIEEGSLGIGWNAGLNNEYIVNYQDASRFIEYFWTAATTTIAGLFLPSLQNKVVNQIAGGTTLVLIILGICDHRRYYMRSEKKMIDIFAITSIVTTLGLYLIGKIAISPTRHSLTLILFIALTASNGGMSIYSSLRKSKLCQKMLKLRTFEKKS